MLDPEAITRSIADRLARSYSRRSFIGRLGRLSIAASAASVAHALQIAAPSSVAFAHHCSPGYHAGPACPSPYSCAANGLADGQYWLSCCWQQGGSLCGNCEDGWKYTKFQDCCRTTANCGGKTGFVYCGTGTCFVCKIKSCTTSQCKSPTC